MRNRTLAASRWIDLDGAVNVRDLGGLPTVDGRVTRRDRLIRSDNLQGLTPTDVRILVDDHELRAVADLRTEVEVTHEGPGPIMSEPRVVVRNLSLFPEAGHNTDAAALDDDAPARAAVADARGRAAGDARRSAEERGRLLRALSARPGRFGDRDAAARRTHRRCRPGALRGRQGSDRRRRRPRARRGRGRARGDHRGLRDERRTHRGDLRSALARRDLRRGPGRHSRLDKHRPRDDTMAHLLDAIDRFTAACRRGCASTAGPTRTPRHCAASC